MVAIIATRLLHNPHASSIFYHFISLTIFREHSVDHRGTGVLVFEERILNTSSYIVVRTVSIRERERGNTFEN